MLIPNPCRYTERLPSRFDIWYIPFSNKAGENRIHGNPYFRLFRHEVEALVIEKYGSDYLENKKVQNELKAVNSELRKIKSRQKALEKRKAELEAMLKE